MGDNENRAMATASAKLPSNHDQPEPSTDASRLYKQFARNRRVFSDTEKAAIREFVFDEDNFEAIYHSGRSHSAPVIKSFYKFFHAKVPESRASNQKLYSKLRKLKVRFDMVLMQQFGEFETVEKATNFQREVAVKKFDMFFEFYEATKKVRAKRPSLAHSVAVGDSASEKPVRAARPSSRRISLRLRNSRRNRSNSDVVEEVAEVVQPRPPSPDAEDHNMVEATTTSIESIQSNSVDSAANLTPETNTSTRSCAESSPSSVRLAAAPEDQSTVLPKQSHSYKTTPVRDGNTSRLNEAKKKALAMKERYATLKLEALVGEIEFKKRSLELEEAKVKIEQERLAFYKQQIESQELIKKQEMEFDKNMFEQLMKAVEEERMTMDDAVRLRVLVGSKAFR